MRTKWITNYGRMVISKEISDIFQPKEVDLVDITHVERRIIIKEGLKEIVKYMSTD